MKNPILLFAIWFFFFVLEMAFPWNHFFLKLTPWFSYLVLGYAFFMMNALPALVLVAISFVVISSFSVSTIEPFLFLAILYGVIFWIRRQTFINLIPTRVTIVLLTFFLTTSLFHFSMSLTWILFLFLHFIIGVFIFWWMEERGVFLEERLFRWRATRGQLHLFEARHLRKQKVSKIKIQRRIRRRFGLRDSW